MRLLPRPRPRSHGSGQRTTVLLAHPGAELYGSDRVLLESVSALVEAGRRVVVTVPVDGPLIARLEARGAVVVLCPAPVLRKSALRPAGLLALIGDGMRGLRAGTTLLRRERPVAVYVNTVTIPLWILLARLARVPVLVHVHEGESTASSTARRVLALPLLLATVVIANSSFSVGVLASGFRRLARTEVVHNGVEGPAAATPARESIDGPLRIVYLGRLSPRKGVDVAVDAVGLLDRRGVPAELTLVGAVYAGYEWYEERLRERIAELGLTGRVVLAGFQPSVWDALAASDVVVVPSRLDEPFGNTAVEAVLAGRPVIASATSGLVEATAGYASARTVAPGDPDALADALEAVRDSWGGLRGSAWDDIALATARHAPARYRRRIADLVDGMVRR